MFGEATAQSRCQTVQL